MAALAILVGGLALVYVLASNPVRGVGRWLAPDSLATIMLYMIFAIRPLFTDRFSIRSIYGYVPSQAGIDTAIGAGTLAMVALAAGAFFASRRPTRRAMLDERPPKEQRRTVRLTAFGALVVAVVGVGVYVAVLYVVAGPAVLGALSGGRSSDVSLGGVPEIVLVLPMAGSLSTAIFLVSTRNRRLRLSEALLALAASGISIVLLSQLGNRRFLIPGVLIPVIAMLIRKRIPLRPWHVAAAFFAFLFVAIIPMVRSAGARRPGENLVGATFRYFEESGLAGVLTPVFASYDTEMLDYLALGSDLLNGQNTLGFGLGRGTIIEFLTRPIPGGQRILGPGYSDEVLTQMYGGGCGSPVCPVASVAGVLYFDGALPAVIIGAFLFGVVLRWLSNLWAHNRALTDLQATAVAVASAFGLVAARTNTIHAIWWAIYALLLMALIYWLVSKPVRRIPDRVRPLARQRL